MEKRILTFAVAGFISFMISGCIMNTGAKVYDNDEIIAEEYNSYNLYKSSQYIEGNCLTGSAEKLEGMGMVWIFDAPEEVDVNMEGKVTVLSGKAKLVMIAPDDTLTVLREYTGDSKEPHEFTDTFRVEKGRNRIKLIGAKDTRIEYEISIDQGEMKTFGD